MSKKLGTGMIYEVRTDRGLCRNVNQDAVAAFVKGTTGLFVLADGMGGHSRGELTSGTVAARFQSFWQGIIKGGLLSDFQMLFVQVKDVIIDVNREIYERYNQGQICGAAVAVLLIVDGCYASFSIGDCRIYTYTRRRIRRLTVDDIWDNLPEVTETYAKEEIAVHRNSGKLTQALGVKTTVSVHVRTDRIVKGQKFLICSDGLYKYCTEERVIRYMGNIRSERTLQKAADQMLRKVFEEGAGGRCGDHHFHGKKPLQETEPDGGRDDRTGERNGGWQYGISVGEHGEDGYTAGAPKHCGSKTGTRGSKTGKCRSKTGTRGSETGKCRSKTGIGGSASGVKGSRAESRQSRAGSCGSEAESRSCRAELISPADCFLQKAGYGS